MSLSKRDLELKFGSPEKLTARLMHLQVKGQPMKLSNDGWVAGTGPDPNDGNITDVNENPARSVPDAAELEFLAGLAGLHQQIIDKISNWQIQKAKPNPNGSTGPTRQISRPKTAGPRGRPTMNKLLEMDIHHLADTRRFSQSTSSSRMTLDTVPDEWMATFERAKTQQDWDNILRCTERARPSIYFAAREFCAGRDSRSQRIAETRLRAADFLDSF